MAHVAKVEKERKKALGVTQSSSTLEKSRKSRHKGRVHFHWKINLGAAVDQSTTQGFEFHGIRPDVRTTAVPQCLGQKRARGASWREASNRGHFYTVVSPSVVIATGGHGTIIEFLGSG